MTETILRMQKDIDKGETNTKEIARIVGEIKEGNNGLKYTMQRIQDTQTSMAEADKDSKAAMAKADQESKAAAALANKELKDMVEANFLAMKNEKLEEKRIADIKKEAALVEEKRLSDAKIIEDRRLAEKKSDEDKEAKIWKRRLLIGLYISIFLMTLSFVMGIFVKYAPHLIGLE